jgi:glycosyltransferase involved in cell wall biosynthesis
VTRALVLATALPFPPRDGIGLRNWQNVVALSRIGPVAVFGLRRAALAPPSRSGVDLWRASTVALRADTIGESLDWLRHPDAVPADAHFSPAVLAEVERLLEDFVPDIVVVESIDLYRYVEPIKARGAVVIVDCHNAAGALERELSQWPTISRPAALVRTKLAQRVEAIEAATLASADQIWACSRRDAELLRACAGDDVPIAVVPNTVDVDHYTFDPERSRERTLVYPAMFAYLPSEAAALFLIDEVVPPLAEKFPDARLVLIGRNATQAMVSAAAENRRVTITGPVEDVRPYLATAGAIPVPLFGGGGTRLKVLEAFAAGIPVVSTAKGVEGLEVEAGTHYLAAQDGPGFVDAIGGLWSDAGATRRLTHDAGELVREQYSWPVAQRAIANALNSLCS